MDATDNNKPWPALGREEVVALARVPPRLIPGLIGRSLTGEEHEAYKQERMRWVGPDASQDDGETS